MHLFDRDADPRSHINVRKTLAEAISIPERPLDAITRSFDVEHHWRARGEAAIRQEMERRLAVRLQHRKPEGTEHR